MTREAVAGDTVGQGVGDTPDHIPDDSVDQRTGADPSQRRWHALVLFSGGQDSTACLAWALQRYARVETIGFDYGQRHAVELQCRLDVLARLRAAFPSWAARLGDDHVLDLRLLSQIADTALTDERAIALRADGLPNTFVPGRNLLFFTYAAALADRRGARVLVGGMCETDYSGYPDCRDNTLKALQVAISLGLAAPMAIETPLMWLDKAATWALADTLGGAPLVEITVEATHTCYLGERGVRHAWGRGCGACPACLLRADGHRRWRANEGTGSAGWSPASPPVPVEASSAVEPHGAGGKVAVQRQQVPVEASSAVEPGALSARRADGPRPPAADQAPTR